MHKGESCDRRKRWRLTRFVVVVSRLFYRKVAGLALLSIGTALIMALASYQSAFAADGYFAIATATDDTSQGFVGFSPDARDSFAEMTWDFEEEPPVAYAIPAEGYEFVMWAVT